MTSVATPQGLHSHFEAHNSCSMAAHSCTYEESETIARFVPAGVSSITLLAKHLFPAGLESRSLTMASEASFRTMFADPSFFTDGASVRFIGGVRALLQHYPQRRIRNFNERVAPPIGPSIWQYSESFPCAEWRSIRWCEEQATLHSMQAPCVSTTTARQLRCHTLASLKASPKVLVSVVRSHAPEVPNHPEVALRPSPSIGA